MLNYVHQLAANCDCVVFVAGQVMFSGFIRAVGNNETKPKQ